MVSELHDSGEFSGNNAVAPPVLESVIDQIYRMKMVLNAGAAGERFTVACSSCAHGQGASTVALNFALAIARGSGERGLLLDTNLRTPSLHHHFGISSSPGFTDIVSGTASLEDVLHQADNIDFISAGTQVDSPAKLLGLPQVMHTIDSIKAKHRYVVVDTAPIVPYPETAMLASRLDGVLLILEAEQTRWEVAKRAKSLLEGSDVQILGAVLNRKKRFIPERIYKLL